MTRVCLLFIICMIQNTRATIVVVPPDDPSEATCFAQGVFAALNQIRVTDPELGAMIDALESSTIRHTIKQTRGITTSEGDDDDHHQDVFYNPRLNKQFPGDGVCVDPIAALLHELYHAFENQNGTLQANREDTSVNGIKKSELNAVNVENLYRRLHGLCPRTQYGAKKLPAQDLIGACPNQMLSMPCPTPVSPCPRCCCWVYNLDGKGGACIVDDLTLAECQAYNSPGSVSAGCYSTPCNFPGTKTCP